MRFSQIWWVIVASLFAFALTVSVLTAQTEEPSAVNDPSRAEIQSDSVGAQSSSDEPEQKQPTLEPKRDTAFADVENERRFNELRRELLDDRAKTLDWWLAATAIFLRAYTKIAFLVMNRSWQPTLSVPFALYKEAESHDHRNRLATV